MQTKCGFVAIVGRPNVGKSTLMNHLIGQKISITSRKPQTTRHKITGVLTDRDTQFIFVDTPGFQKKYLTELNAKLNESVVKTLGDVDAVVFVVEAGIFNVADENVALLLPKNRPVVVAVNKIDQIDKIQLKQFIQELTQKLGDLPIVIVSAKEHQGMDTLINLIDPYMPESEWLYPEDNLTDRSSKFLVSEIIREKLFRYLGDELPYQTMVEVEKFVELPNLIKISALIIVDKENQKAIVIGDKGDKLKKISTEARLDIEKLLDNKVFLQVWVKVKNGFAAEAKFLAQFE